MTSWNPDRCETKKGVAGHKWYSISEDSGHTWSIPEIWTYDNREKFYSPSSCSMLLNHSNGKVYWIGNITPTNPDGNLPRYPLVYGEVNPDSGMLIKKTVKVIDTKNEGDSENVSLSNFTAHEDRETGDIVLYLPKLYAGKSTDWTADLLLYRIKI
jgi:hypothetical protein